MPFDVLKPIENNDIKKTSPVENTVDVKKYTKPELEEFHKNIIKDYPQSNEKNLQTIIETLDKDLGDKVNTQGFDVIKDLLKNDPNLLSGEKTTDDINKIIKIIKDEINIKEKNKDTEIKNTEQTIINQDNQFQEDKNEKEAKTIQISKNYLDTLYSTVPEDFIYQEGNTDPKIQAETDNLFLKAKDKLKGITEEEYKRYLYTALKLSKESEKPIPNKIAFIKQFNEFNEMLDIDVQIPFNAKEETEKETNKENTTSLSNFAADETKILNTKGIKEYVENAKDLIDTKQLKDIADEDILKLYKPEDIQKTMNKNFEEAGIDIDITKYIVDSEISEERLRQDQTDEKTIKSILTITDQVKEDAIKKGKEEIIKTTNKIMKEKIMTNVFKGLAGYFDITNSREENFADDLELDIAEDKSIMEERTIKLDGKINGHATGFYYNLRTGEFQMDDVVNFSERLFKVGKQNKGEKFTLPVKLPTLKEMRQTAKNTNIGEILETSDDLSGYEENLSGALDDALAKDFSHTELNKYYIEKYNEKNLVMQESLGYVFDNLGGAIGEELVDFDGNQEFASETKPNQYQLFFIIDRSMEHYRNSGQYTQLRDAFEKFDALINTNLIQDNPAQMNAEPLIQKLFNEDTMGESGNNRKNGQSKEDKINYTTFYELISDDFGVIDLRTLETINDILEKGNGETIESMITKDTSGLSKNFINKYQQNIVAENFLEENSSARDTPTA